MILRLIVGFIAVVCIEAKAQVSQNFYAERQPQYELGAGVITLNVPDYPGAESRRFRFIPFPYYIYRGEYLRADDEGTRARLLTSRYHETGLSLSFNFPVNSSDNPAREGMPSLDALMGLGPRFLFRFIADDPKNRLNLSLSMRALFSSNFKDRLRSEGLSLEPSLSYWHRWLESETSLFSSLGFEFGSVELARYFYNVPELYQTPTRETFGAHSGLIEASMSVGVGQNFYRNVFVFSALSWRNLDLAANRESPLVATTNNLGFILGVVWTFYESEETVQRLIETTH